MKNFKFQISNFPPAKAWHWRAGKFPTILIAAILGLAAILRLYRIGDYMNFLGDEGRDVLVVYNILHGKLTLLGPTSSVGGFFLGPIYYYFSAPFLFLSRYDPVGPAIMVAIFGIATVWLVYKLGESIFNRKVGLVSAFIYAISPTIIIYSRSSWNPNLMPFFTILTLWALYLGLLRNKHILLLISGFLFGILMQLHYLATFVSVIIFAYTLIWHYPKIKENLRIIIKQCFLMFGGFLIGFAPFIAFELRHGFTNSLNIINFIFNSKDTGAGGQILTNVWEVFLRLFGGIVLNFPLSARFKEYDPPALSLWLIFSVIIGISSLLVFAIQTKKERPDKEVLLKKLLIGVWVFVGISLFAFYKKSIYDYYLLFLAPVGFLLVGNLIVFLFSNFRKAGKILSFVLVMVIIALSHLNSPLRFFPNRQVEQTKTISNFILEKSSGKPYNFALMSGGNSDHAYKYFFRLAGKDPTVIENPQIDPDRKSVTDQLFVICDKSVPCSPLGYSLWEIAGFGRGEIAGHWNISVVEVFKIVHYQGKISYD